MKIVASSLILIGLLFLNLKSNGQEATNDSVVADQPTEEVVQKPVDKPVRLPFECGLLIDNQTTVVNSAKTLELIIDHRFGTMDNGITDLYGIYAPSNIQLGLNYSITNKLMVGIGTTKNSKLQDLQWKYILLQQTKSGRIPITIAYYGNAVIDASNETNFGANYVFASRLSYFNQIMISRKFNNILTLQASGGYVHFNSIDSAFNNDNVVASLAGRVKISPQSAIIFEYQQPLMNFTDNPNASKPNAGIGLEVSTSSHAFQIFVSSYGSILNQHNVMYNTNDFTKGAVMLGFNMTRKWNF